MQSAPEYEQLAQGRPFADENWTRAIFIHMVKLRQRIYGHDTISILWV